eukprot:scaffold188517_cov22-Tisochrysis_lutea.AAC.1
MAGAHLSRKQLTEFVQAASLCKRLSVCKQLSMAGECLLCDAAAVSEHNVPRVQLSVSCAPWVTGLCSRKAL